MFPYMPSLQPTVGSSICIDPDTACDEEAEIRELEKEHQAWVIKTDFIFHTQIDCGILIIDFVYFVCVCACGEKTLYYVHE